MGDKANIIRTPVTTTGTIVGSVIAWALFFTLAFLFIELEMPVPALIAVAASILSMFGIYWNRTISLDVERKTMTVKDKRFFPLLWPVRRTESYGFEDIAGVEMESKGRGVFMYYKVFIQPRSGEKLLACNLTDMFTALAVRDKIAVVFKPDPEPPTGRGEEK